MIPLCNNKLKPEPSPEDCYTLLERVRKQVIALHPGVAVHKLELRGGVWWAWTSDGWQTVNKITKGYKNNASDLSDTDK